MFNALAAYIPIGKSKPEPTGGEGGRGDQTCSLECVKRDNLQQFEGPVKIILVEPSIQDLNKRILESSLLAFCHLFIGAVVILALYFSYICRLPIFISAHIAACTTGFQLFLPSAFLILNPYFGGSIQIKNRQRKSQHSYLIHLALIFGLTGGLHILCYIIMHAFPYNPHTVTGVLAIFSAIPAFVIGPILYYTGICSDQEAKRIKKVKYVHTACGVFCFAMSSLCYCTSFFKPSFQKWAGLIELRELPFVLSACVLFYTIIIIRGVDWQMQYHNNTD